MAAQKLGEFRKIIVDFTNDTLGTFPELQGTLHKDLQTILQDNADTEAMTNVFEHCKTVYPTRFFDILYMNVSLFTSNENGYSNEFLPGIDFTKLWQENISEKTRETIWKYLQLVLFSVVSDLHDGQSFGEAANLFEAINGDEFKSKLESTMKDMHDFFQMKENENEDDDSPAETGPKTGSNSNASSEGINLDDLPDPSSMHEHINSMMNGKLGKLAREIAEETAADLNINSENAESINDVFKKLIQNPTKLMSLVKNVGSKLDAKLKAGDMKESDLMQEASDIMKKMKNMPGMGNLQSMFAKMGMPGMPPTAGGSGGKGKSKVDVNAMQAHLARNLKATKNKEKLLERLMKRQEAQKQEAQAAQPPLAQQAQAVQQAQAAQHVQVQSSPILVESTFQKGEAALKSSLTDKPLSAAQKKKARNKKKKNLASLKANTTEAAEELSDSEIL
jgi:hypothetical protein